MHDLQRLQPDWHVVAAAVQPAVHVSRLLVHTFVQLPNVDVHPDSQLFFTLVHAPRHAARGGSHVAAQPIGSNQQLAQQAAEMPPHVFRHVVSLEVHPSEQSFPFPAHALVHELAVSWQF